MDKDLWKSNLPDGILDPRANVIANNKSRANGSDLNWLAATIAKNKEMAKDPKWIEANKGRHSSIDWFEVSKRSGATRKEIGEWLRENDPEEFKRYFGYIEKHTEETKSQMSDSAKQRWAKTMKRVIADGVEYDNHYAAAEALGIHKDTIIYRIKNKSEKWRGWFYCE